MGSGKQTARIRRALEFVPTELLMVNPGCGLCHLSPGGGPGEARAMVAGDRAGLS